MTRTLRDLQRQLRSVEKRLSEAERLANARARRIVLDLCPAAREIVIDGRHPPEGPWRFEITRFALVMKDGRTVEVPYEAGTMSDGEWLTDEEAIAEFETMMNPFADEGEVCRWIAKRLDVDEEVVPVLLEAVRLVASFAS